MKGYWALAFVCKALALDAVDIRQSLDVQYQQILCEAGAKHDVKDAVKRRLIFPGYSGGL